MIRSTRMNIWSSLVGTSRVLGIRSGSIKVKRCSAKRHISVYDSPIIDHNEYSAIIKGIIHVSFPNLTFLHLSNLCLIKAITKSQI